MRATPIALLLPLASCGALLQPGPFAVPVTSDPPGATVVHRGEEVGTTPCTVLVTRGERTFELRLAEHHTRVVDCGTRPNPWALANLLTLGVGVLVDGALGTGTDPDTAPVHVRMTRGDARIASLWIRPRARVPQPPLLSKDPDPAAPYPRVRQPSQTVGDAIGKVAFQLLGELIYCALR